jgi:very-short-patch-repair endonuclease
MNLIDAKAAKLFHENLVHYRALYAEVAEDQPKFLPNMALAEDLQDQFVDAVTTCESPIEQMMLSCLMFVSSGYGPSFAECRAQDFLMPPPASGLCVVPQYKVSDYRIDLALFCRGFNGDVLMLAIECDGHEWHEKTKEQAKRDRKRDRALQALGWQTMRFTGSEIFEDAMACVDEIGNALTDFYERGFPAEMKDSAFNYMRLKWKRAGFRPPYVAA